VIDGLLRGRFVVGFIGLAGLVCPGLVASPAASAAGEVYWTNESGSDTIEFANLDGSGGGGNLNTSTTAAVVGP